MEKVAKFEKVSFNQFKTDCQNIIGENININVSYESIKLPERATIHSAGYDFFLPFDLTLDAGKEILIPTGIRFKSKPDFALIILPKSGLGCKFRLQLDNTIGLIDSDYYNSNNEGHIIIKIINDSRENKILNLEKGKAFVQAMFVKFGITIDDFCQNRRNGGFGSTQK